jgi:hypothetical protein
MRSIPAILTATVLTLASSFAHGASLYDQAVREDTPVFFQADGHGTYASGGAVHTAPLPNGEAAAHFDGASEYLEIPSTHALSIATTGALTFEAWLRPDKLQFPHAEAEGFVYWLGKGQAGEQEYAGRMYSLANSVDRPNRISGYAFNPSGGFGSGSYFQDALTRGQWIHVAVTFNTAPTEAFPTGYVRIYRDGVLRDTTALGQFAVHPVAGNAPLRIGTRDLHSFFDGAIGKVAVYGYELTAARLQVHFRAMR